MKAIKIMNTIGKSFLDILYISCIMAQIGLSFYLFNISKILSAFCVITFWFLIKNYPTYKI
jgi:hypothetical protein